MAKVCLMTSSTSVPGLFNQERVLYKSKQFLSLLPCSGRKLKMQLRLQQPRSIPLVEDPMKRVGWLFTDQSTSNKSLLTDVQVSDFSETAASEMRLRSLHEVRDSEFQPLLLTAVEEKRSSRTVGREHDLCRRSKLHSFETLLSLLVDKNRGKLALSSVKKSSPELSQLLNKFSVGIAGAGLAILFSVVCKVSSGRTPIYASTMFNTGFGSGLVWLSWAVNKLRDTVVCISKSSSNVDDKEMMREVDKNVNAIFFRATTVMAVVVLRFARASPLLMSM